MLETVKEFVGNWFKRNRFNSSKGSFFQEQIQRNLKERLRDIMNKKLSWYWPENFNYAMSCATRDVDFNFQLARCR